MTVEHTSNTLNLQLTPGGPGKKNIEIQITLIITKDYCVFYLNNHEGFLDIRHFSR